MTRRVFFALCMLLLPVLGCNPRTESPTVVPPANLPANGFPRTVTDMSGKPVTLKAQPKRIVSLTPSTTEILFALGLGEKVVGVTTACDFPPEATKKPKIGGFQINTEAVLAQNPDLVVAMAGLNGKAIEALGRTKAPLVVLSANSVQETLDAMTLIGKATGTETEATKLTAEIQSRLEKVAQANKNTATQPRVLMLYGVNPIYTTGPKSYLHEVITLAGGKNAVEKPIPGDTLTPEQVIVLRPDVIVGGKEVVAQARQVPGWATGVVAVKKNQFFAPSSDVVLVRPGPRLPQAVEELATYLRTIKPDALAPKTP